MAPCPISSWATRIVTASSGAMATQQVISERGGRSARAGAVKGMAKPSAKPPLRRCTDEK